MIARSTPCDPRRMALIWRRHLKALSPGPCSAPEEWLARCCLIGCRGGLWRPMPLTCLRRVRSQHSKRHTHGRRRVFFFVVLPKTAPVVWGQRLPRATGTPGALAPSVRRPKLPRGRPSCAPMHRRSTTWRRTRRTLWRTEPPQCPRMTPGPRRIGGGGSAGAPPIGGGALAMASALPRTFGCSCYQGPGQGTGAVVTNTGTCCASLTCTNGGGRRGWA